MLLLERASERGAVDAVASLLVSGGVDVRADDDVALRRACALGHARVAALLLRAGADARAHGGAPLESAAFAGHADVARVLISAGADVHASDNVALQLAAVNGHAATVEVLIGAGADVHADADGPLRRACEAGHVEVVLKLIAAGADVHARGDDAVRRASEYAHTDVVRVLLEAGAEADRVVWTRLPRAHWPALVLRLRRTQLDALPVPVRPLWLRIHVRLRIRLGRRVHAVRERLERLPTGTLRSAGTTTTPTRDDVLAYLRTGGRAFARDYWTQGLPIFFPGHDFGPWVEEDF